MKILFRVFLIAFLFLTILSISAEVRLPKLIGNGLVLQRDMPLKIWGWASPKEALVVNFNQTDYRTSADENGNWEIILPPQPAGGPYSMTIKASNSISINDILIGDVWLCSGQSNMELPMLRVAPIYKEEIASADYPNIRYFEVPKTYSFKGPQEDLQSGKWVATTPQTVLDFSAAAYFFAKELYNRYQVPVGLINSALGGSPIEAWISEDSLKRFSDYYREAQLFKSDDFIDSIQASDRNRMDRWYKTVSQKDKGNKLPAPWYSDALDISDWQPMNVPGYWPTENDRPVNGVMWFRRSFDVSDSLAGKPSLLILGTIVDADSVFINGTFVGTTSYQYPPRRYAIPAGLLRTRNNSITVRVISNAGRGGFTFDKEYGLEFENQKINLEGIWHYKSGARMEPLAGETVIRWKPAGLFNAMIAPLLNYPLKGAIWYQGESNAGRALEYRELFPTLIRDWRSRWNQGDFPFLFVQLPNFMKPQEQPVENSGWALLRESQLKTLSVPNTGMAVAIDIGEWNDVHPLNKRDVGRRLALIARRLVYGENDIVYSGPIYKSMKIEGNKIVLSFSHVGSGLKVKGERLKTFAIAGKDKKFVWANAVIEDDHIVVWSDEVKNPVAVRYAWADNPVNANLFNKEGLPASPFRTDE